MNFHVPVGSKSLQKAAGKHSVFFYLRLLLAVLLLLFLVRMVDFRGTGLALASVKPHLVVAALFAMLFNYCLKSYRWASILWIQRPDISFGQLARFNFVSIFLGNFLPSSFSPDVVRIYYVSQYALDPRAAISSIFADRIIGNFALAILTMIAVFFLNEVGLFPMSSLISYGAYAFLVCAIGAPLALRNQTVMDGVRRVLHRFTGRALFESVQDISDQLRSYANQRAVMAKALVIAFVNLLVAILEFYLIAKGFSTEISMGYFILFIPLVILLSTLPLSLGGLGLMEASVVFFFSRVGMPVDACFAVALVFRALQLICMLPGAAIYVSNGCSIKELAA